MIKRKTWEEFQDSKMLWCANRVLHMFGWAIVFQKEENGLLSVYPARVEFRGFDVKTEVEGFIGLSKFISENHEELLEEAEK